MAHLEGQPENTNVKKKWKSHKCLEFLLINYVFFFFQVWHLGSGLRSQQRLERGETKGDLFLKHYSFVIDYILRKYPGKRILLWDDMLRTAPMDVLNRFEYGLIRDQVELVVWQYSPKPDQHLPGDLLLR